MDRGQFAAAAEILDRLMRESSPWADEAAIEKVALLILTRHPAEALLLFRPIEGRIARDVRFYNAWLAFAMESPDPAVQEEFANKFIGTERLPGQLQPIRPRVYARLAALARARSDPIQAGKFIGLALSLTQDPRQKRILEAEQSQLALLGTQPPPLRAGTWFPPAPVDAEKRKGKAVIVVFWAPWCPHCRQLLPALQDAFERHGQKGLLVLGCTKLYGSFADDGQSLDRLSAAQEIAHIGRLLSRRNIAFPVAVDREGVDFEAYRVAALPTLVWIGRDGTIRDIQSGADDPETLGNRVAAFAEVE